MTTETAGERNESSELPEAGGDPIENTTAAPGAAQTAASEDALALQKGGIGRGVVSGMRYGADGLPLEGEDEGPRRRSAEDRERNDSPASQASREAASAAQTAQEASRKAAAAARQEHNAAIATAIDRSPISVPAETNDGAFAVLKYGDATKAELEEQIRSHQTAKEVVTTATLWSQVHLPENHDLSREELLRYLVLLHDTADLVKPTFDEFVEGIGGGESHDDEDEAERAAEALSLGAGIQDSDPRVEAAASEYDGTDDNDEDDDNS